MSRNFQINGGYRYGFNGKENDNEVKGDGNQQDYGMRIYDPRLGKFLSVDPISKSYPSLTPYQFASNSVLSGVDRDGLEFYYAADGKFLGQGSDPKNLEVRLAKEDGYSQSAKRIVSSVDIAGKTTSQWVVIHNNHDEFLSMAGTAFGEASGSGKDAMYGISNAILNKHAIEKQSGFSRYQDWTIENTLENMRNQQDDEQYAKSNPSAQAFFKATAYSRNNTDMKTAISGAINAFLTTHDYSNGAIGWDGNDFGLSSRPAYKIRYLAGYKFSDAAHGDMFGLSDNSKPGKIKSNSFSYMFQSTAAYSGTRYGKTWKTIFYRPTDDYIKAVRESYSKQPDGTYKYEPYGGAASKSK